MDQATPHQYAAPSFSDSVPIIQALVSLITPNCQISKLISSPWEYDEVLEELKPEIIEIVATLKDALGRAEQSFAQADPFLSKRGFFCFFVFALGLQKVSF